MTPDTVTIPRWDYDRLIKAEAMLELIASSATETGYINVEFIKHIQRWLEKEETC